MRTSTTHPLIISELPCGNGLLGLTICPGKCSDSIYGSPWERDLEKDLRAIDRWGATCVVTLMEEHELRSLMVPDLGAQIEALGMDWLHLPIVDVSVPADEFERRWVFVRKALRSRLNAGERILIHCRGGLGRTGIVAARLLIDFGIEAKEAVRDVRRVRPGAIETREQERYVLQSKPYDGNWERDDRVLRCLMGGAVGDAFGYTVEFDSLATIRRRFGPNGLVDPVPSKGKLIVSDDTQMTLFTAEGLCHALQDNEGADNDEIIDRIRGSYLQWYRTQHGPVDATRSNGIARYRELWSPRAPGNTCMSALRAGGNGSPENPVNNSKGCGGVMRVAPLGLVEAFDQERAFLLAQRAAALTHGHSSGHLSAGALASLIRGLLAGLALTESLETTRVLLMRSPSHRETLSAIDRAVELAKSANRDHDDAIVRMGEGWVGEEALAIALYAVLVASSYREAIAIAANHDGDSDSTASIAGQIWGAAHGLEELPASWVLMLDVVDPICEVAEAICALNKTVLTHAPIAQIAPNPAI